MITEADIGDWRALVVDDHADSREVAKLTLEMNGAHVTTAENGEEGLNILKTLRPTFILLDLSMPVMDGWTMLHHIRDTAELADIPVIALTAHAMDGDETLALNAGFDHYIAKPFSPMTFVDELLVAFNKTPALAERLNGRAKIDSDS